MWGGFVICCFLNCGKAKNRAMLPINLADGATGQQLASMQRPSSERNILIKDEMRLMHCSWEKIKCAHNERVYVTIINEVIITFELM